MQRRSFAVIVGLSCTALGAWALARDLGPEWTKVGIEYVRAMEVKARRYQGGNVTNYAIKMENHEASLHEIDDNQGFGFRSHPYGSFEVRKHKDGTAASFNVNMGEIWYRDLNGDGFFDEMTDSRGLGRQQYIFFEGRFIPANDTKSGHASTRDYEFKNGSWLRKGAANPPTAAEPRGTPGVRGETIETKWVSAGSVRGWWSGDWPEASADERRIWAKVIAPANLAQHAELGPYLNLVRPRPEEEFTPFKLERLSSELLSDSIGWMEMMLHPDANPYASITNVVVPPRRPIGAKGPRPRSLPVSAFDAALEEAGVGTQDYADIRNRIAQARGSAPVLRRSRPTKFHLSTNGGLSLLWYEYDGGRLHFQIIESSAALLIRFRPHTGCDLEQGIPRTEVAQMLADAVRPGFDEIPLEFQLPEMLTPGCVFLRREGKSLAEAAQNRWAPHWSTDIVGFVTDKDICLVLRKANPEWGAQSPLASHFQEPHPDWLRNDLYEADGVSLVIDRQPKK